MDFFEAQEFFANMYPGKDVKYEFDENCHRIHELVYTDGKPNLVHHIEHRKVKVTIEGMDPLYIPIAPHREGCTWAEIKRMINSKVDIHINQEQIDQLKALPADEKEKACQQIAKMADLSVDAIRKKVV